MAQPLKYARVGMTKNNNMYFVLENHHQLLPMLNKFGVAWDYQGHLTGSGISNPKVRQKIKNVKYDKTTPPTKALDLDIDKFDFLLVLPMGDCG